MILCCSGNNTPITIIAVGQIMLFSPLSSYYSCSYICQNPCPVVPILSKLIIAPLCSQSQPEVLHNNTTTLYLYEQRISIDHTKFTHVNAHLWYPYYASITLALLWPKLPYLLDQKPRLLIFSSRSRGRPLFESG